MFLGINKVTRQKLREIDCQTQLLRKQPCNQRPQFSILPVIPSPPATPVFTPQEEEQLTKLGASKTPNGKWLLPDGREMLSKPILRGILAQLHQGSHWAPQAMCNAILRVYGCMGIYTAAKQVNEGCITYRKVNKKALRKKPAGGRKPGIRPFQSIQMDYTEMPKLG